MAGLINALNNTQLDQLAKTSPEALGEQPIPVLGEQPTPISSLAGYVQKRWEEARRAKEPVERRMLASLRAKVGEYDSRKLSEIKEMGGSEVYMMLTDTKCRSAQAWIRDILFQAGAKPWDIEPTPIPELPPEVEAHLVAGAFQSVAQGAQSVGMTDPAMINAYVEGALPGLKQQLLETKRQVARELCEQDRLEIEDQLVEGGWYEALDETIPDIVVFPAGFIKGPIFRKEKSIKPFQSSMTGQFGLKVDQTKLIPQFERKSPFCIYPQPGSNRIDGGYLIDRDVISRKDLADLMDAPGFDSDNIRAILAAKEKGELHDWLQLNKEIAGISGRNPDELDDAANIDFLNFWGPISGRILKDWKLLEGQISDPDKEYEVVVWMIGRWVIKAVLNPDPLSNKPYAKVCWDEIPGEFWGRGIPDLIAPLQQVVNAISRAIVNNVAIASGPQVEVNIDRYPTGSRKMWPFKTWEVSESQMASNAPALNFYQPSMVVDKLVMVFQHFSRLADEYSGVPAYAHGDTDVTGAGKTASGLSMLFTSAARGIKAVIKAIDNKLIAPTIKSLYLWGVIMNKFSACDYNIVARGSASLIAKEQQAMRRTEFMNLTNNPVDIQIMGLEGRKNLIKEVAKNLEIPLDAIFPMDKPGMQQQVGPNGMAPNGMAPGGGNMIGQPPAQGAPQPGQAPAPRTLDAAGNPAQGTDFRMFNPERRPNA